MALKLFRNNVQIAIMNMDEELCSWKLTLKSSSDGPHVMRDTQPPGPHFLFQIGIRRLVHPVGTNSFKETTGAHATTLKAELGVQI